jgi:hypothetical protein
MIHFTNIVGAKDEQLLRKYFKKLFISFHHSIWRNYAKIHDLGRTCSKVSGKTLMINTLSARGRFHQHIYIFTPSFYARSSSKRIRTQSSCLYLFTLLGSTSVKAVHRTLVKLSPGGMLIVHLCFLLDLFCKADISQHIWCESYHSSSQIESCPTQGGYT